ncbi:MAG TPA: hypothetical protein VJP08_00670 [Actinomycetota bacterium]|nr:hypothetical protein [Actinomycetota bacterium]
MASAVRSRVNLAGAIAAVLAGAVTLGYVGLILVQGEQDVGRVVLVACTIASAGIASWAGSVVDKTRARSSLLGAAAGALLGLGYLALFSIGLLLVLAGLVAAIGAFRESVRSGQIGWAAGGFVVGLAVALGPLLLTA